MIYKNKIYLLTFLKKNSIAINSNIINPKITISISPGLVFEPIKGVNIGQFKILYILTGSHGTNSDANDYF